MSKNGISIDTEQKKPAIVFLSIAAALFLAFIGFFIWHTVRMRSYELTNVKIYGTVVDVEKHRTSSSSHGSRTYYYMVISYTYEDQEYTFTDRTGYRYDMSYNVGKSMEIYVDPKNPSSAEAVTSSGFVSIICACFFAFFCVTYAAGMNILLSIKGSSFTKRLLFVWGIDILLGITFMLLFWLGLPYSGFGEVFDRIEGAVGLIVVSCLVALVTVLDAVITFKLNKKY